MKVDVSEVQFSEQYCNQSQVPRDRTLGIVRNRVPIHANEIGKLPYIQAGLPELVYERLIVHVTIYTCFYELCT